MRLTFKQIGFGAAAIGAALGISGCEAADAACDAKITAQLIADLEANGCPSLVDGEVAISGVPSVDTFFASVVRFGDTATSISAGLDAELQGLQADFGLTDEDVSAAGGLGAALRADIDANIEGDLSIKMEPARCEVDAQAQFSATAECQADAGCEVEADPGTVEFECKGGCTAEVSAMVDCGAEVDASCDFQGPAVECSGTCEGSCTVEAQVAAECTGACTGTCSGSCDGTCSAMDGQGNCAGECDGTCDGMCEGSCTFEARAGAECSGSCNGTCTATGPMLDCTGAVEAHCEGSADASVMCEGSCDGEFEPPMAMVMCEASASCNASAEANASIDVQCTPPSIELEYGLKADLDAKAQLEFEAKLNSLKARLPALSASLKKGNLVLKAGAELTSAAGDAGQGLIDFVVDAEGVGVAAKAQAGFCALDGFKAVGGVVGGASGKLTGSVDGTVDVFAELGI